MNRTWTLNILMILILAGGALLIFSPQAREFIGLSESPFVAQEGQPAVLGQRQLLVALDEINGSGQFGAATLAEEDGFVVLTINTISAPADTLQPAHIHTGKCAEVGEIIYPLSDVVDGRSQTTLEVSWDELLQQESLSINIHTSSDDLSLVSCGTITDENSTVFILPQKNQ